MSADSTDEYNVAEFREFIKRQKAMEKAKEEKPDDGASPKPTTEEETK